MFWNRFLAECDRIGKKPNPVADHLGISSGTITGWKKGSVPQQKMLEKLSDYFGCTVDYLIGKSECRTIEDASKAASVLSAQEKTLLRLFRETTEEGRLEMIAAFMNIKKKIEKKYTSQNPSAVG